MTTVAVVPVRMGSSRLPGKTLRMIAGKPLLGHLLDRLALCHRLDRIVVATSDGVADNTIADYCQGRGVACFRGSEDDVLGRLLGALTSAAATTGVLVFGDCPLIDPAIIDSAVALYQAEPDHWDFVGNDLSTTYPPGMEVEVFRISALADADRRCADPSVREHGTLFIRSNPGLYRLHNLEAPFALRRPELEIEVDVEADLAVAEAILEHFADRPSPGLAEIITFLDSRPDLIARNRDIPRRWKIHRTDLTNDSDR